MIAPSTNFLFFLQSVTVLYSFLFSYGLDTFVEYWSIVLWLFLNLGLSLSSYDKVMCFWKEYHKNHVVFFSVYHIKEFVISACLITGNVIKKNKFIFLRLIWKNNDHKDIGAQRRVRWWVWCHSAKLVVRVGKQIQRVVRGSTSDGCASFNDRVFSVSDP